MNNPANLGGLELRPGEVVSDKTIPAWPAVNICSKIRQCLFHEAELGMTELWLSGLSSVSSAEVAWSGAGGH